MSHLGQGFDLSNCLSIIKLARVSHSITTLLDISKTGKNLKQLKCTLNAFKYI